MGYLQFNYVCLSVLTGSWQAIRVKTGKIEFNKKLEKEGQYCRRAALTEFKQSGASYPFGINGLPTKKALAMCSQLAKQILKNRPRKNNLTRTSLQELSDLYLEWCIEALLKYDSRRTRILRNQIRNKKYVIVKGPTAQAALSEALNFLQIYALKKGKSVEWSSIATMSRLVYKVFYKLIPPKRHPQV